MEKLAQEGLAATLAKGTAQGLFFEMPTEVAQQVLDQLWQQVRGNGVDDADTKLAGHRIARRLGDLLQFDRLVEYPPRLLDDALDELSTTRVQETTGGALDEERPEGEDEDGSGEPEA